MTRTTLAILLGLALAALAAARLEGSLGVGLLAGFLLGSSMGLLGQAWQRHVLRVDPARAFGAMVQAFLFKMAGLLLGVLSLRYLPGPRELADWRSFALGYASAAFLCLLLGSFEILRSLKGQSAP